jgi:hypothetical protein
MLRRSLNASMLNATPVKAAPTPTKVEQESELESSRHHLRLPKKLCASIRFIRHQTGAKIGSPFSVFYPVYRSGKAVKRSGEKNLFPSQITAKKEEKKRKKLNKKRRFIEGLIPPLFKTTKESKVESSSRLNRLEEHELDHRTGKALRRHIE